ncbi:hypothetical protein ZYGM_001256 [Zygosaccharomyces mellis]|uniref:Uncharacterized protein n=1 Tax=Zygosaccharomyces mellis TaxID=42258 RepID=A0A4C2E5W5_9SACH|nr:hypothetical protein ZYGM_001256 [Zygosaccharomyces mellis]
MQGVPFKELKNIQKGKSLKHYIFKLRSALKNNKLTCRSKKELGLKSDKKKTRNNNFNYPEKRSLTSTNNPTNTTLTRKRTQSVKTQDSIRCKKVNRNQRNPISTQEEGKRHNSQCCQKPLAQKRSESSQEQTSPTSSQSLRNSKHLNKENRLRGVNSPTLNSTKEHPMLQQELVANIDGSYIQFQLVSIDPKLLLQDLPPVMAVEPMPSLIWPYN